MRHIGVRCAAVFALLCLFCTGILAFAAPGYTLRVDFITEAGPVSGARFSLYPAMTLEGDLTGDFAGLPVETGDLEDSENLSTLAFTLASFTASGVGEPLSAAVTDGLGSCSFAGLSPGIYLLTGTSGTIGENHYTPKPTLIKITGEMADAASVKYTITASAQDALPWTVEKVWQGAAVRPAQITVQLLGDGEVYDEVTLSEENGWRYTWEGLSQSTDWYVMETPVPEDYYVTFSRNGQTFTIVNRASATSETVDTSEPGETGETEPSAPEETSSEPSAPETTNPGASIPGGNTPTPPGGVTPTPSETGQTVSEPTEPPAVTPTESGSPQPPAGHIQATTHPSEGTTNAVSSTEPPTLPQTGQLWWPVPVLFLAGLLLFLVGYVAGRVE